MRLHRKTPCARALFLILFVADGCDDAVCPTGTKEVRGHCKLIPDAGTMGSPASIESGSDAGTSAQMPIGGATTHPSGSGAGRTGGVSGAGVGAAEGAGAGAGAPSDPRMSSSPESPMMSSGSGAAPQPTAGSRGAAGPAGSSQPKAACGNGMQESGELCDGADCPSSCTSPNACLLVSLMGSAATCDARCGDPVPINVCMSGDGCCPEGCKNADDADCSKSCGDGVVDAPEKCESTSQTQPCPTSCDDGKPSTMDILTGTAQQCSAECVHMPITTPKSGDDYCPPGANANNDDDCAPMCGNKVKESGEECDGNCPSSCPRSSDPCIAAEPQGTGCNVKCVERKLTASKGANDGCCPPNANATTDSDCEAECGNGVTEPGETCDANCPRGCSDSGECSIGQLEGAGTCSARCTAMTVRASGTTKDGRCCGKNAAEDADCPSECGNGVLEPGEACELGAKSPAGYTYDSWSCNNFCMREYALAPCSTDSDCGPPSATVRGCSPHGRCYTVACTSQASQEGEPVQPNCWYPNGTSGVCSGDNNCLAICKSSADCPPGIACVDFGPVAICDA
jgi:hypothetical protein